VRSLAGRLALTHLLVVLIAVAAMDALVLVAFERLALHQRQVAAFTETNIAVNLVEPYYRPGCPPLESSPGLLEVVRSYATQSGSRVLALDGSGRVVADSMSPAGYTGRTLTHPEVAAALAGRSASRRRYLPTSGWVLYTVAPVLQDKRPVGAVFLATSLADVTQGLAGVARTMVLGSLAAVLVAGLAGVAAARSVTGPVVRLTRAVERMGRGDLGQRVAVRGRDEVATLTRAFNEMATRLQEEDERRREFLADVAHELQTPVAAIRAMAEPMAAGDDPSAPRQADGSDLEVYREFAREMAGQAERLGRLVGDLLELARLESPKVRLTCEEVDLADLARGVLESLRRDAEAAGVDLRAGSLEPVLVVGDGLRLEQVLVNLVTNGLRYAGAGRTVRVDVSREGGEARLRVADDGPGIAPEHLPHLFERFYRVDRSRSRRGGGTGLGLAIVKRIVELHGGSVSVVSRPGEGTTFEVRLPAARGPVKMS